MAKKGTSSIVLCMRKVLVRSALVLCINVVIAPKKVTEKVKKWEKIATLWLFLSHRGCHMAPRLQKHEYLLATMVQSDFEHFRMSGSIITWELFLSLTSCFRSCSFFVMHITSVRMRMIYFCSAFLNISEGGWWNILSCLECLIWSLIKRHDGSFLFHIFYSKKQNIESEGMK